MQFSRVLSYIKGTDIEIFLAAFQTVLQALLSAVITVSEELERLKACGRTTFTCIMNLSSNESHLDDCLLPVSHIIALIPINILSSVVGTIGNSLVIATVYTNKSLQIIPNLWLASMAVADLMVTALGQPLLIAFWGLHVNRECNEPVSETFRVVGNMSCSASVLHLCFISIDRCLLIVRPVQSKAIRTLKRFKLALLIAWIVPVIYGVLRMSVSKKTTSYFTVIAAAICYLTIICCYTLIIFKVWNRDGVHSHARQSASQLVERRVTVTVAIVVVVFTICWIPLMYLRSAYAQSNVGVAYNWARTLALSNSAMNPWIYCFRMEAFLTNYKRLLKCGFGNNKRDGSAQCEVN